MVSEDVKQHWTRNGGRPELPVPSNPYGLCGRKATVKKIAVAIVLQLSRACAHKKCYPHEVCADRWGEIVKRAWAWHLHEQSLGLSFGPRNIAPSADSVYVSLAGNTGFHQASIAITLLQAKRRIRQKIKRTEGHADTECGLDPNLEWAKPTDPSFGSVLAVVECRWVSQLQPCSSSKIGPSDSGCVDAEGRPVPVSGLVLTLRLL